jgi:DMSO reductase anchor subunit
MAREDTTYRVINALKAVRESGLSGDISFGAIAALLVGLPHDLYGPGGEVWGVPMALVWGGTAGVAAAMCSLALLSEGSQQASDE